MKVYAGEQDYDLGLYYLQSRYYDSNTGRLISADGYVSTGQGLLGYHMYAYCNNDPMNMYDRTGCIAVSATLIMILSSIFFVAFF